MLVPVARDQDDPRFIVVPLEALDNPHVATDCGGRRQPLERPNLAGYMDPGRIPADTPFGYSGIHQRARVVPIKVLVREDLAAAEALSEMREQAKRAKLRKGYRGPPM